MNTAAFKSYYTKYRQKQKKATKEGLYFKDDKVYTKFKGIGVIVWTVRNRLPTF